MTAHPNSKKDRGFQKLTERLAFIHEQPDSQAANAAVTDFHGANAAQIRRLYIDRVEPGRGKWAGTGKALVDDFTAAWNRAHSGAEPWTGADLRAAREALGLSMVQLADYLPWKQSRVSEAERDLRRVPAWVPARIGDLERTRDLLVERMAASVGDAVLIVHETDAGYRAAHPTDPPIPAAVHRVAAALAVARVEAETGERPRVVYSG
jgi:hypothetical protein